MSPYKNIIEMEIWSSFGSFSKPFSNSGGILTYLIPPKTAIIGMIGSVLGYEVNDYEEGEGGIRKYRIEELYDVGVSIQPFFELVTKRVTFNSHYGGKKGSQLNAKHDVLVNPGYIIYLSFPEILSSQEKEFLESIKKKETVYNLYMGRNNFPLNYEFLNYFKSVDTETVEESFRADKDHRLYGTLNRNIIKNVRLTTLEQKKKKKTVYRSNIKNQIERIATQYDYLIKSYPIRRRNFTDFEYIPVSFFSTKYSKKRFATDIYYSYFEVRAEGPICLYSIGDGRWITLI